MRRLRLLLADDHVLVAESLRALLAHDFDVEGVVHDGRDLVQKALATRPDVIVTDLSMPGLNGLDAVGQIRRQWPAAVVLIVTMHTAAGYRDRARALGAAGLISKDAAAPELLQAIRKVAQGGQTFPADTEARHRPLPGGTPSAGRFTTPTP